MSLRPEMDPIPEEPLRDVPAICQTIRKYHRLYPNAMIVIRTHAPRVDYSEFMRVGSDIEQVLLILADDIPSDSTHWLTATEREALAEHWTSCTGRPVAGVNGFWRGDTP